MGKGWPEPSPLTHLGWGPGALTCTHLFCWPVRGLNQGFLFPVGGGGSVLWAKLASSPSGGYGENQAGYFFPQGQVGEEGASWLWLWRGGLAWAPSSSCGISGLTLPFSFSVRPDANPGTPAFSPQQKRTFTQMVPSRVSVSQAGRRPLSRKRVFAPLCAHMPASARHRACTCTRAPTQALSQPSPRPALRWRLTCAFLLVPLYALEPLEHAPQVGDSMLEGDALVLRRGCLPQDLPHVLFGGGLQPASTWQGLRAPVARTELLSPSPPFRKRELPPPL